MNPQVLMAFQIVADGVGDAEDRSLDGEELHRRRGELLRGEAARVDDHEPLRDRVRAQHDERLRPAP